MRPRLRSSFRTCRPARTPDTCTWAAARSRARLCSGSTRSPPTPQGTARPSPVGFRMSSSGPATPSRTTWRSIRRATPWLAPTYHNSPPGSGNAAVVICNICVAYHTSHSVKVQPRCCAFRGSLDPVAVAQHRRLRHLPIMPSARRARSLGMVTIAVAAILGAPQSPAQTPSPDYPEHPPAPAEQLARGEQIFRSNCSFCHGSDARGGETGPNLVRDEVVLRDQRGELITPIVQNGIPAQGMPKFALSAADIADIAAWLHSRPLSDRGTPSTLDILVGSSKEGEAYFNGAGHCTQCHSATGDLAGIGSRYEPKTIQNLIVSGGGGGRM